MPLLDETKLQRRSLARNELLFRQGDKVQAIYFIEQGRLRLDRRTFDGRSLVIGINSAGEFFVEAALFAEIFHCDAVATEPSRVRIYPKAAVLKAVCDVRIVLPDDRVHWVRIRASSDLNDRDVQNQLSGVFVDVTEQKAAENEALMQRQEVAHLMRVSVLGELSRLSLRRTPNATLAMCRNSERIEILLK